MYILYTLNVVHTGCMLRLVSGTPAVVWVVLAGGGWRYKGVGRRTVRNCMIESVFIFLFCCSVLFFWDG